MVATGLTGSFSVEDKDENVMQAFVYDDESSNKGIEDNKNDESINVFSDSEDINRHSFSSDSDDQYDVPAFLRKK